MSEKIDITTLVCRDQNKIGCITLNSPKTLNALSLDMVLAMQKQLDAWSDNDSIACIIIKGAGEKAFCAGGDIQAVYHAMKEKPGQPNDAEHFFTHEYRLDYTIHQYPKPVIIWGNGIVMGGGLGIFMGGDFRVVTESSRVAMPEITIALYPDVGASYFLNQMPGQSGRFLGLTGASINAADCLFLGLADDFIQQKYFGEIKALLKEQCWGVSRQENIEIIEELISSFAEDSKDHLPEHNVENHMEIINSLFSESDIHQLIDNFLDYKTKDNWLKKAQSTLKAGSPLSALIIDHQLQISKGLDLASVFKSELVLSTNITRFSEFSEGIRALLIEKDNAPNWHFKNHRDVPKEFVDGFFEAPWDKNPLEDM